MRPVVLVLNVGSSSIKFALYPAQGATGGAGEWLLRGQIKGIGANPALKVTDGDAAAEAFGAIQKGDDHDALIERLLRWIDAQPGFGPIAAVGHRVVHGGGEFAEAVRLDAGILGTLATYQSLAPLHQPHNLAGIRAVAARHPDLLQVACFDTAFHQSQDRVARLFALPRAYAEEGVLRYGFHGLSYDYIARVLPAHLGETAEGRVVVAHLGNGASMCAMRGRRSVATTMGFTALDGLVMGCRTGSLDPGVVLYLMQEKGMDAAQIEDLLYRRSGLLGVSGVSSDMQALERSDDPHAKEAIELFCYRAVTALGGLVAALGGLDALIFTAGIGENSAQVRRRICERLDWLGVRVDARANAANETRIGAAGAPVETLVLPTDEESVIVQETRRLLV